jgi:hypothetical protein
MGRDCCACHMDLVALTRVEQRGTAGAWAFGCSGTVALLDSISKRQSERSRRQAKQCFRAPDAGRDAAPNGQTQRHRGRNGDANPGFDAGADLDTDSHAEINANPTANANPDADAHPSSAANVQPRFYHPDGERRVDQHSW